MDPDLSNEAAIRWHDTDPAHVPLLSEAGITAVVASPGESFANACASAKIRLIADSSVRLASIADAAKSEPGRATVIKAGVWPGIQRQDPQTAGATGGIWLDQNCGLVNCVRALMPRVPCVLGYGPDKDAGVSEGQLIAHDALELALVDAWVAGGNYLMTPDARLVRGVLGGNADARAAWKRLGRTAAWLRANQPLFRQPVFPTITVLVDSDLSQEIASLSFRNSVSPRVADAANPPDPDPSRCQVLVAVGIDQPSPGAVARILAHANAGASVLVDGQGEKAWWRSAALKPVRSDADRDYLALGKGQVVAYKTEIEDPGSLALDVIDVLTQNRRPARIWNCHAGLVMATAAPPGRGSALLHLINYSRPLDLPVLARIHGAFSRAQLLCPESPPMDLKVAPRAGGSEVTIPKLQRVATIVFN